MKVLVVYAHPNPKSYNHAILESFTEGLSQAGHSCEVLDLYAINFNPCLNTEELAMRMEGKAPEDVQAQQEKVSQAEALVLIHPVWWVGTPAILKGWIDRVFSLGFAYNYDETGHPVGILKHKKALIINTAGATEADAEVSRMTDILKQIESDHIIKFCGINDVQHVIFYNVIMADDTTRKAYLEECRNLGKDF